MDKNGGENSDRPVLDLKMTDEGVSCEDYSLILIAGPDFKNLSRAMRDRLNQHTEACAYHRSSTFIQSALGTCVTPELEEAAKEVIEKYDSAGEDKQSSLLGPIRSPEGPPIE